MFCTLWHVLVHTAALVHNITIANILGCGQYNPTILAQTTAWVPINSPTTQSLALVKPLGVQKPVFEAETGTIMACLAMFQSAQTEPLRTVVLCIAPDLSFSLYKPSLCWLPPVRPLTESRDILGGPSALVRLIDPMWLRTTLSYQIDGSIPSGCPATT